MSNDKALTAVQDFALTPINSDVTELIKEELDGLGQIPFDTIKVPSGGGLAFELPGDDPDNPETTQTLTGVIVHHHAVNSYWPGEYDGSNTLPDCSSADGKQGLDIKTGELRDCSTCPFNQFGSSSKGNGKACKNGHRIYLLRSGEVLPVLISLPPTSLRAFKDYIAKRLVLKGKRTSSVLTTIKLKREKSADGIAYSSCVFTKAGDLTPAQIEQVKPTVDWIKSVASTVPVVEQQPEISIHALREEGDSKNREKTLCFCLIIHLPAQIAKRCLQTKPQNHTVTCANGWFSGAKCPGKTCVLPIRTGRTSKD